MQIIEHFLSIQGEGLHPGRLTYFVRFARCNLRCAWCDSRYSFAKGKNIKFETITAAIKRSRAPFVCLTGGEPLLHKKDCLRLIKFFPDLHFDIETGGSLDISGMMFSNASVIMDWKLKHSGMGRNMKRNNLKLMREGSDMLKFVTNASAEELQEIKKIVRETQNAGFPVSVQPVNGASPAKLAEWMVSQKNPRMQFNLQIHKYVWPGRTSGV